MLMDDRQEFFERKKKKKYRAVYRKKVKYRKTRAD